MVELLCTLGPASFSPDIITRLSELGVSLFRINLSHTGLDELPKLITNIRKLTDTPICLDTEGAQVRTGELVDSPVILEVNNSVELRSDRSPGTSQSIPLYPEFIASELIPGDLVSIDFNAVLVHVQSVGDGVAIGRILNGGEIGNNKAVTVDRSIELAPLTEKDRDAIIIGKDLAIKHFALSFANCGKDVNLIRSLAGCDAFIISKIESRQALGNLDEIIDLSDAILIDRGDLSREVAIETIPIIQRRIIQQARSKKRIVYVATNLLESMVSSPIPTRAEANDVYSTLEQGASGLVLAAETAIGKNPIASAGMIKRLVSVYESDHTQAKLDQIGGYSLLNPPLGGRLIQQEATEEDRLEVGELPVLAVDDTVLVDAEQIVTGVYSPLDGFMDSETLRSVLDEYTLGNDICWTLPIVFQVNDEVVKNLPIGGSVILTGTKNKMRFIMRIKEVFQFDNRKLTGKWFGTDDLRHPGVNRVYRNGNYFVAGKVLALDKIIKNDINRSLTPAEIRTVFTRKEWSRVVGFHTRNAPHRAHEHIMVEALKDSGGDGLLISPFVGPKKSGDLLTKPLLESHVALLGSKHFPGKRALLSPFRSYPRYAGPREAVFTALCRKNMGCSHFVMGRDHTGVADFYPPDASQRLLARLGDIGISLINFPAIAYDGADGLYKAEHSCIQPRAISGSEAHERILRQEKLPTWFMSDEVQDSLRRYARFQEQLIHN